MKKEMVRQLIVSAAAAAVGAFLVWAGFDIYDRMTESAEECALKARITQRETNEKAEELLAQINWSRDVLQRLQKSSSNFRLKNLIYALHKDYGINDNTTVFDNGYVPHSPRSRKPCAARRKALFRPEMRHRGEENMENDSGPGADDIVPGRNILQQKEIWYGIGGS